MKPHQLIGLRYRLGADPVKHHAADCLSLARTVLKYYGITSPEPTRDWYKRVRKKDPNRFKKILSRTPLDRFGKVEDISNVVGFLCSPEAKFITGTTLPVDGGFHSSF